MSSSHFTPDHHCCAIDKKRLAKDARRCRSSAADDTELHSCLQQAAKASRKRVKTCMYS